MFLKNGYNFSISQYSNKPNFVTKITKKKINFFFQIYYTLSILPYQSTSRRKGVIEFVSGIKISETNLSLFYAIEAGFIFIM